MVGREGNHLSKAKFNVVVIGGGFSGALLAVQLFRRAPNLSVAVVDRGSIPGRGVAYGTKYDCHLLNVRAGNMSALPEEPDHFLNWARRNYQRSVQATSFLPRPLYGRYVSSLLEEAIGRSVSANFRWIQGEVCSLESGPTDTMVQLKDGSTMAAEAVVLASGNFPPGRLNIPGLSESSERYIPSAWSADALQGIPRNGSVLLVGSGLTSIDVALALKSEGFAGHIHILSRHGLMPQTHRQTCRWPQFWNEQSPRTTRGLLRLVREQVRTALEAGTDWRSVIEALRPATQKIWQSLPIDERKRFLRHVRAYWEVHRHRIAPEIGETISKLVNDRQATLYAGRVVNYREFSDRVEVDLRERKIHTPRALTLRVDRVINCTGPETNCQRINDPLIKSLLAQGLARPDALSLGLDTDSRGALIGREGEPSHSLYAIGPIRKGQLWETIAVPELRMQASQLAEHLVCALQPHKLQPHKLKVDTRDVEVMLQA